MRWICATTAPWVLSAGLLVSFTASASNNAESGISFSPRGAVALLTDASLVPPAGSFSPDILRRLPHDEIPASATLKGEPLRADRKIGAGSEAAVERSRKGNPNGVAASRLVYASFGGSGSRLLFTRDENLLPPTVLMEGKVEGAEMEQRGFEPWQAPEISTTTQATSIQSPLAAAAGSTGAAASATTPSVRRAVVLSSTTPAASDSTPTVIAAAPVSREHGLGSIGFGDDRPRYADLVDPDDLGREQRCLAEAVYFEARSESPEGQAAVAQVVLNRVKSGLYPASICGVVYQNRHRHLACQFTFACEGKALRTTESEAWDSAKRIASAVLQGRTYLADVGGATHYHANYVRPYWAKRLKKMDVIGRHVFYKLWPGQT